MPMKKILSIPSLVLCLMFVEGIFPTDVGGNCHNWRWLPVLPVVESLEMVSFHNLKSVSSGLSQARKSIQHGHFHPILAGHRDHCASSSLTSLKMELPTSNEGASNRRSHWRPKQSLSFRTLTKLRGGSGSILLASSVAAPTGWVFPALACATSYSFYNLFIKKASDSIDPMLGGVLLQLVAAGMGLVLWLLSGQSSVATTRIGIGWSMAAGLAVGAAEILSFIVSGKGVPATKSIPIIVGGSIVIGTIVGAVWLKERLTLRGWLGVLLIASGIALVGVDPGSSMGH